MNDKYIEKFKITCYDTDKSKRMKPVSFMNYAQELATCHASVLGFGYDELILSRTAWIISRMHVKFLNTPQWRDNVEMHTWHKGQSGLFYLRDFCMYGADSTPAVVATSSWLVMNLDTRHVSRESLSSKMASSERLVDAIAEPCGKVIMPHDGVVEEVGVHVVEYSDLDMNGHANNAKYVVWAMDALDPNLLEERCVKELRISFNSEARLGDTVSLMRCCREDSGDGLVAWIEGLVDGHSSFGIEFTF